MTAPLDGVRVLDLTTLLPGPWCTMTLADLGADVVKIERPGGGDPVRTLHPPLFDLVNRNKRGICLDLASTDGRRALLALARDADVLVDGFRPGTLERLGLDGPVLEGVNPRLVRASLTGYGIDGPDRDRPGHDLNYLALAGALEPAAGDSDPPSPPRIPLGDLAGGALTAAVGILAALVRVQRTGRGGPLSVSLHEGTLALQTAGLAALAPDGDDLLTGRLPTYACYACADGGHVALAALERPLWRDFCRAVGRAELAERVPDPVRPGASAEALRTALAELFATRSRDDWTALFDAHTLCATPVLTLEEALARPQVARHGMTVTAGGRLHLACPIRMAGFDFRVARTAPAPGQHQVEVLAESGHDAASARALAEPG